MRHMVSTADVPEPSRAAVWRGAVRRWLAPVEVTPGRERPFAGRLGVVDLGYVRVLSMEADPMRLTRSAPLVAAGPGRRLALLAQVGGASAVRQDGRGALVGPGHLALLDLRRPFVVEQRQPSSVRWVRLPQQALGTSDTRTGAVTGRAIPGEAGVAAVLALFTGGLAAADGGGAGPAEVGERLGGTVADLVATLIDEVARAEGAWDGRTGPEHTVAAVRRYIDAQVRDADLDPARIARAHGISVRYLHRLFQDEDITVRRLIQQRRVEGCARELARRGRAVATISAVAQSWGFRSPAHFCRAFKGVYGQTPRAWVRTVNGGG
ncbi:helix-turn-helix domain-containing protein [Streptomyces sp. NPDC093252]|uniref:helix-turn-helix domain-containing protein n=1 Tax=Streptomyces sp. NPDC093252 TaxID=3154980 RepID=UPI0034160E04